MVRRERSRAALTSRRASKDVSLREETTRRAPAWLLFDPVAKDQATFRSRVALGNALNSAMRLPSKKCASVIQLVTFARLIVPIPDHHRAWQIPAPQPRREPVRPSISCSTSIIIMPTGTSNAPCIVLFTVNVKERVGMLMTRTSDI